MGRSDREPQGIPEISMVNKMIRLIIDEWKAGNQDDAQLLCAALAYNVFVVNERERDTYFTDQARNVFIAAIMAEVEDSLKKNDEEKININSIIKHCNTLCSVKTGIDRTALDDYFDKRPEDNFARITYGAIITASEQTKGTIMSVFRSKVAPLLIYKKRGKDMDGNFK